MRSPIRLQLAKGHVIDAERIHLKLSNDVSIESFGFGIEAMLVYKTSHKPMESFKNLYIRCQIDMQIHCWFYCRPNCTIKIRKQCILICRWSMYWWLVPFLWNLGILWPWLLSLILLIMLSWFWSMNIWPVHMIHQFHCTFYVLYEPWQT